MRRNFLLSVAVAAVLLLWGPTTTRVAAQPLAFGMRVGLNTSTYGFDTVYLPEGSVEATTDRSGGFQAGLFARLSIPFFIYFQPEINLVMRDYGFGIRGADGGVLDYNSLRTLRFEVPVLVGVKVVGARFFGGPVWRVHSSQQLRSRSSGERLEVRFDDNDIATTLGAAIEFGELFVEMRYLFYLGQTTSRVSYAGSEGDLEVNHDDLLQISFGLFF